MTAALVATFGLHALHLAEARFVLQNRLPNFQTYPSFFNMVRTQINDGPRGLMNGMPGYVPIVSLLMTTQFALGSASLEMIAL